MEISKVISQHPNQESKTGNAPYASFTRKNFSNNESLPGRTAYMKVNRIKRTSVETIYMLLVKLYQKLF